MEKTDEQLHSFPFCENIEGIEHTYRITENANHAYGLEKDGRLIAEVSNDCEWRQISGEALEERLLQKICDRIEDHFPDLKRLPSKGLGGC